MQKNRSFNEENNNNLDDDDDEENVINPNLSHDSHSENLKIKNNKQKIRFIIQISIILYLNDK